MKNSANTKKRLELLLLSVITAYFAVLAYYTPRYGAKARLFPIIILILGAVLLAMKFLAYFFPRCAQFFEPKEKTVELELYEGQEEKQKKQEEPARIENVPQVLIWLILAAALFYFLGIVVGVFLSVGIFFLWITRMKWYTAMLSAALMTGLVYVVFNLALNMRLYSGLWF